MPTCEEIRSGMKKQECCEYRTMFGPVYKWKFGNVEYVNHFGLSQDSVARMLQMIIDPSTKPYYGIWTMEPMEPKLALCAGP